MTLLNLAILKPTHLPFLNYVILDPTITSKVMTILIEYIPRLWNSLPVIDIIIQSYLYYNSESKTQKIPLEIYFVVNFDPNNYCTFYFLCPCHKYSKSLVTLRFSKFVL